jgi:hypothetical protein
MNPLPLSRLHHTFLAVPARLPVCSHSSGWPYSLIVILLICKLFPFACTIPLLIGGFHHWVRFFRIIFVL